MTDILFITRGLGWGHSVRDMLIINMIKKFYDNLIIKVVSHASGLAAFRSYGVSCIELDLTSENDIKEFECLIKEEKPQLVVVDEEIKAIELVKNYNLRCIFITNWLSQDMYSYEIDIINKADVILFAELPDFFNEDENIKKTIKKPIIFTGPICKINTYQSEDIFNVKKLLNIKEDDKLVLLTLGGRSDIPAIKANLTLLKNLLDAYFASSFKSRLCIVSGSLKKYIDDLKLEEKGILVMNNTPDLLKIVALSDFVIARGGITTLWELACIGVPSLSIPYPYSVNPFEERYAQIMHKRGFIDYMYQYEADVDSLLVKLQSYNKYLYIDKSKKKEARKIVERAILLAAQYIIGFYNNIDSGVKVPIFIY